MIAGAAGAGRAPAKREAGGGRTRARCWHRFDPHTGLDLARRLSDRERCELLNLLHELRRARARLEAVAARHYEVI